MKILKGLFVNLIYNLILFFLFVPAAGAAKNIDTTKTLFGFEYTFQDKEMLKEDGRDTITTPYKDEKLRQFLLAYLQVQNWPRSVLEPKTSFKAGWYINTPTDGKYVVNTEPVTIEFNTTPKRIDQIIAASQPIYAAANVVGLVPYVNPAAERSGMGHVHVGGQTLQDSPFYRHENLLRNAIVFFHKHPALLYGFAEAYDVGMHSNIETYHAADRQQALQRIIESYDNWWLHAARFADHMNGFLAFVDLLRFDDTGAVAWTSGGGFFGHFAHYRNLGLKRLKSLKPTTPANTEAPFTVEFRSFRPPPSPAHAKAVAELLLAVLDYLAEPNLLEPFEVISPDRYANFFTGSKILADWQQLKSLIKIQNPYLDEMLNELVISVQSKAYLKDLKRDIEIFEAYSEKEFKGSRFELRLNAERWKEAPEFYLGKQKINFEKIQLGETSYWISNLNPQAANIRLSDFRNSPLSYIKDTYSSPEAKPEKKSIFEYLNLKCPNLF